MNEVVEIPIDGVLDLHAFQPNEVHSLVKDYIELCAEKGITEVRIIHGKGRGVLRKQVQSILKKHPLVVRYHDAYDFSGWGATIAQLRRLGR